MVRKEQYSIKWLGFEISFSTQLYCTGSWKDRSHMATWGWGVPAPSHCITAVRRCDIDICILWTAYIHIWCKLHCSDPDCFTLESPGKAAQPFNGPLEFPLCIFSDYPGSRGRWRILKMRSKTQAGARLAPYDSLVSSPHKCSGISLS